MICMRLNLHSLYKGSISQTCILERERRNLYLLFSNTQLYRKSCRSFGQQSHPAVKGVSTKLVRWPKRSRLTERHS